MAVTRQLFELQEIDSDIENTRQTLGLKKQQLGNRDVLDKAAALLAAEQKNLDELKKLRRDGEVQAADINAKINETNKKLYGGSINNPKELGNLQAEVKQLTAQKDTIETALLTIIERLEDAESKVKSLAEGYQKLDTGWAADQTQMAKDIEMLTATLATLQTSRQESAAKVEPQALALYERIRRTKKPAVAKVQAGICSGCRLSLSASALQKARGGRAVQCGTCGRILFIS